MKRPFALLGPLSALCLAVSPSLSHAQRNLKNIPDPTPEVQLASFQVAEGFEVNLFASDPMIAKPVQIQQQDLSPD